MKKYFSLLLTIISDSSMFKKPSVTCGTQTILVSARFSGRVQSTARTERTHDLTQRYCLLRRSVMGSSLS